VKILTTNEVVYTSLACREPGPVNRASSIIYSTGLVYIPTGVVHNLPRDKLVSGSVRAPRPSAFGPVMQSEQPLRRKIRLLMRLAEADGGSEKCITRSLECASASSFLLETFLFLSTTSLFWCSALHYHRPTGQSSVTAQLLENTISATCN